MKKEKVYLSTIDPEAQVLARSYGLGLEISEFSTAWNLDDSFTETDKAVREKMKGSSRFVMHGPFNELFPCAIDRKVREVATFRYLQAMEVARRYGIHKIVLHGGYNPKLYFPVWYTEQSIAYWKDFAPRIPEDMELCLENVFEEEPDMLADIVRAADCPRLRMCLDVGHVHAYSKISEEEWVRRCGDIIDHFHVHNNDTTWDTHSDLNCGTIPMKSLLNTMHDICPNATVTLELIRDEPSLIWLTDNNLLED